jgi:pyridoxamine 5'-phosphate oxidase family protein
MSVFSEAELAYLAEGKLGRLATVDRNGMPHVVPLGWSYNTELDTIDIGGRDFAHTAKFRNVKTNPQVALVVDDVLPPWRPRCVMIRGHAEALDDALGSDGEPLGPIIRISPTQVISWGLSDDGTPTSDSAGSPRAVPRPP